MSSRDHQHSEDDDRAVRSPDQESRNGAGSIRGESVAIQGSEPAALLRPRGSAKGRAISEPTPGAIPDVDPDPDADPDEPDTDDPTPALLAPPQPQRQ